MKELMMAAEQVSLFCRIQINTKKEIPIRSSEMGMLIYLVKEDGEKTPMGVARFFKTTKAMATNMVSSLVKKGYLSKSQSENDKRSFLLIPTEKAVKLVNDTYEEYFKTMMILRNGMGESEFQEFIRMLAKANHILLEGKDNG